jgi:hypothetical protein
LQTFSHDQAIVHLFFLERAQAQTTMPSIRGYLDKRQSSKRAIKAYTNAAASTKQQDTKRAVTSYRTPAKRLGSHGGRPILGPKEMDAVVC